MAPSKDSLCFMLMCMDFLKTKVILLLIGSVSVLIIAEVLKPLLGITILEFFLYMLLGIHDYKHICHSLSLLFLWYITSLPH
jgi:hypothetical protein